MKDNLIIIGKWNNYFVFLRNSESPVWFIIDKKGKIQNTFESKESFGHWIYHSGFKPKGAK